VAHTAPPSPKRRLVERFFIALTILVGLGLGAVALVALQHPNGRVAPRSTLSQTGAEPAVSGTATPKASSTTASTSPKPTKSATPTATATKAAHLSLVVLSNTGSRAIADTAAGRFRDGGWTISSTGLFDGDILSSVAYYDPSVPDAEKDALALQAQYPAIKRVKQRFDGLPEGPIIVVLTNDYS
jgi:hypothetical protein